MNPLKKIIYIGNYLSAHNRTPNFNIFLSEKFEKEGFRVIKSSSKRNPLFRILDMWLTIFKERNETDFVIIDVFSSKAFWFAWTSALLSRILRMKYICIVRGGNIAHRIHQNPKISGILFNHAHINIAPSEHHVEVLEKNRYPTIYIPNFLDLTAYHFQERKKAAPKLYWVRSLHEVYQPMMAVRLLERILKQYPEAKLTMVGPDKDGSLSKLEAYIREKNLQSHIHFTGLLSKTEWHQLSSDFDIFLNTTSIDNHPVSVIEAMALGMPIVSTNAGGLKKLLVHEETALLSAPDNEDDMYHNIIRILESPELCNKLSKNARSKAETFDWRQIKEKYDSIFNSGN